MSDYKQTRDAAGRITTQYDKMLRNLDDDLVKRLREVESNHSGWGYAGIAADRIEELEANINIKADFIDATINQLEAAEQRGYANAMEAERKLHEDRIEELEAERDAALVALFECMEEIDAYIQQEYPQDHPVHERYRQRDYAANPARMFLRDRPDALVKARAMLAEADLERQIATLKGQNDE